MPTPADNMMSRGAAWLAAQSKAHASESVSYGRTTVPYGPIEVLATRGNKPMRVMTDFGPRINFEMQDWLIEAADLDFGDGPVEPVRGDTITAVSRGMLLTYEAMPPDASEPVWRWAGPNEVTRRIHTKLVAEEPYA